MIIRLQRGFTAVAQIAVAIALAAVGTLRRIALAAPAPVVHVGWKCRQAGARWIALSAASPAVAVVYLQVGAPPAASVRKTLLLAGVDARAVRTGLSFRADTPASPAVALVAASIDFATVGGAVVTIPKARDAAERALAFDA